MPPHREATELRDLPARPAMAEGPADLSRVALVVIGRNEGRRLRRCLRAALRQTTQIVYVDSGSTDGSPELARRLHVPVVELDAALPFTAARGRNVGFERLMELYPDAEYVQFLDGDCEIDDRWLARGIAQLDAEPRTAVVAGHCRERFPNRTVYNRLCDIEWRTPVGEARACGGNALIRVAAYRETDGFNPDVAAGEELDLCTRLRQRGWRVWRVDADMVRHDAEMLRFSQWWKRTVRTGCFYAQSAALHGKTSARHCVWRSCSTWLWGLCLPVLALGLAWPSGGWSLLLLAAYLLLAWRIFRRCSQRTRGAGETTLYIAFTMLGKFPEVLGHCKFHADRLLRRRRRSSQHETGPHIVCAGSSAEPTATSRNPV